MIAERAFGADSAEERLDEALLALTAECITAREIALLTVGDLQIFADSATVRLVGDTAVRYVRVREAHRVAQLRCYVERDAPLRRAAPLFLGRSHTRGMSWRNVYRRLAKLNQFEQVHEGRQRA